MEKISEIQGKGIFAGVHNFFLLAIANHALTVDSKVLIIIDEAHRHDPESIWLAVIAVKRGAKVLF